RCRMVTNSLGRKPERLLWGASASEEVARQTGLRTKLAVCWCLRVKTPALFGRLEELQRISAIVSKRRRHRSRTGQPLRGSECPKSSQQFCPCILVAG